MSLSSGRDADRFLFTAQQYAEQSDGRIPDRFGDAFLTFNRPRSIYFNREFELSLKRQRA